MSYYKLYQYDELYHHGVQGQKWGVRRYQNEDGSLTEEGRIHYYGHPAADNDRSAIGITTRLNKTAKTMAKADVAAARARYKVSKYSSKLRGDNSRRDAKLQKKIDKQTAKAEENEAVYNYGLKRTNDLINQAKGMGYTVNSKETKRYVDTGRDAASYIIAGLPGMAVNELVKYSGYSNTRDERLLGVTNSNSYKVSNSNSNSRPVAMLTSEQAKQLGYGNDTRLSKEEESAFWKAMAEEELRRRQR